MVRTPTHNRPPLRLFYENELGYRHVNCQSWRCTYVPSTKCWHSINISYKILTHSFTHTRVARKNTLAKKKGAGLDQSVRQPEVTSRVPHESDLSPNSGRTLCPFRSVQNRFPSHPGFHAVVIGSDVAAATSVEVKRAHSCNPSHVSSQRDSQLSNGKLFNDGWQRSVSSLHTIIRMAQMHRFTKYIL